MYKPDEDIDQNELFPNMEEAFSDDDDTIYQDAGEDMDFFDDTLSDIDFSEFRGDFRSGMKQISKKLNKPQSKPMKKRVPIYKSTIVKGKGAKKMGKVIVPRDRKVIIEGVNKFLLSQDPIDEATKNIGYYKGKKLRELVLTINNQTALDFNLELFNPSMPLDYTQSTSQNLNDMIQVAGPNNDVSYTDVLFNLLANPTLIPNAKFVVAGPSTLSQISQALIFKNKTIEGKEKVLPYQMNLQIDTMQVQGDIVYFDIMGGINRPFIPDGMDVIQYKVLAGMSVTFAFYYKQKSLKKAFFKEARNSKKLM